MGDDGKLSRPWKGTKLSERWWTVAVGRPSFLLCAPLVVFGLEKRKIAWVNVPALDPEKSNGDEAKPVRSGHPG